MSSPRKRSDKKKLEELIDKCGEEEARLTEVIREAEEQRNQVRRDRWRLRQRQAELQALRRVA